MRHWAVKYTGFGDGRARSAARYIGRVGGLAVALGIGAAVAGGAGIANADDAPVKNPKANSGDVRPAKPQTPSETRTGRSTSGSTSRVDHRVNRPKSETSRPSQSQQKKSGSTQPGSSRPAPRSGGGGAQVDRTDAASPRDDTRRKPRRIAGDQVQRKDQSTVRPRFTQDKKSAKRAAALLGADAKHARHVTETTESAPTVVAVPVSPRPTPVTTSLTSYSNLVPGARITTPSDVNTGDTPLGPGAAVMQALQLARRDMDLALVKEASIAAPRTVAPRSFAMSPVRMTQPAAEAATTAAVPQPGDVASTPYGDIGKWMLKSGGQVANWGGQLNNGQPIYEPINVIIIDDASTSREESITKLNRAMKVAGFPARTPHSGGYKALIDGATHGQQPTGFLQAFASSGTPTDHGRMFGPADSSAGYVWTGAFSTQNASHRYVSFVMARDDLASQLVASGVATSLESIDMGNAGITGDHDGYAVVLVLNPGMPNTQPTATLKQNDPNRWSGMVTGQVTASDADGDRLTYVVSEPTMGAVMLMSRGMFRYTPTAAARHAAAADGVEQPVLDAFSITVSDGFGGVADVPVSVVVLPKNTVPTSWARVNRPDASGNVVGSITVRDADGDQVVYRHTDPSSGSVTINPDGTFTYVPTESARQQAKSTPGPDFDTFTITVDDGHGGLRTMTVRATIAPAD